MRSGEPLMLTVECPGAGTRVIRAVGDLDRVSAPRLARLLDDQLDRCMVAERELSRREIGSGSGPTMDGHAHLVVDLAGIRHLGTAELHVFRNTQSCGADAGVVLHLTGLGNRTEILPPWAERLVAELGGFSSLDDVVAAITRHRD